MPAEEMDKMWVKIERKYFQKVLGGMYTEEPLSLSNPSSLITKPHRVLDSRCEVITVIITLAKYDKNRGQTR